MVLQFLKEESKPHTLKAIRSDGSITWFTSKNSSAFFAEHDLCHFVVETVLGYTTAFYGMIASGANFEDFNTPAAPVKGEEYSDEAMQAEQIVGLIQQGGNDQNYDQFCGMLDITFMHGVHRPKPKIELEQYLAIREYLGELYLTWRNLSSGEVLELIFPDPT